MTDVLDERRVLLHFTPELVMKMYNGTFTIDNPKGGHATYRLLIPSEGNLKGKQIIQLMTGPDNENHFKGFGFVNHDGGLGQRIRLSVWRRLQGTPNEPSAFDRHARLLEDLFNKGDDSTFIRNMGLKVMSSGKCCVCGRKLTTPESIEAGIGPICAGR